MVNHHASDHLFQIKVRRHLFWIKIGSVKFVIKNWHRKRSLVAKMLSTLDIISNARVECI
jgi:hypothetical protein